jgi:hypothetical protein
MKGPMISLEKEDLYEYKFSPAVEPRVTEFLTLCSEVSGWDEYQHSSQCGRSTRARVTSILYSAAHD